MDTDLEPQISPQLYSKEEGRDSTKSIDWSLLTDTAHDDLCTFLTSKGNTLGDDHKAALLALLDLFSQLASGTLTKRVAVGLPCGMGKTSAVKAWLGALAKLGGNPMESVGVSVASSKVEELCDLKRSLVDDFNVPADAIGIVHSFTHDPDWHSKSPDQRRSGTASEPATEKPEECPILLITHARVHMGSDGLSAFQNYRGRERQLMIFDESLLVSAARSLRVQSVVHARGFVRDIRVKRTEIYEELEAWLSDCLKVLDTEAARQRDQNLSPCVVRLPYCTEEKLAEFKEFANRYSEGFMESIPVLSDFVAENIRVTVTSKGDDLLTYTIRVPSSIKSIAVLDASYVIRELEQLDSSIVSAESLLDAETDWTNLKDHRDVTTHQMCRGGGRASMKTAFRRSRKNRDVSQAVIEVVKSIPAPNKILIFTHKQRSCDEPNQAAVLESDLKAAGIDSSRIRWATWGQESGTNEYADISNVILCGIYRRSDSDIAAHALGQTDNLLGPVDRTFVDRLVRSEVANAAYQAICRTACRRVDNGRALKTNAWIIDYDDGLFGELEKVLPGATFKEWTSSKAAETRIAAQLSLRIVRCLAKLAEEGVARLSVYRLKKRLLSTGEVVAADTFTRALNRSLANCSEWVRDGRSIQQIVGGL